MRNDSNVNQPEQFRRDHQCEINAQSVRHVDGSSNSNHLASATSADIDDTQRRPQAESTDLERRRKLMRLLRREDSDTVNAAVLEHIYDEYGGIDAVTRRKSGGIQDDVNRRKKPTTAKWEMKTVF
jgi:hypothetical protein